jgi:Protein of unknown function (DUF5672)
LSQRVRLDDVTLCCVDTRDVALALAALRRCMAQAAFAQVLFFTRRALLPAPPDGIRVIDVDVPTVQAYSQFMLRGLQPHVRSSHVLVAQWDGFVRDASRWKPEFLEYDYIGAPWHDQPAEQSVGNGGFSLRSQRLLTALADPSIILSHPEDIAICQVNRRLLEERHGIRIAPRALADVFSYERVAPPAPTFGFHGLFNFARELSVDDLGGTLRMLPDHLARGLDAHDLCRTLIREGRLEPAQLVLDKRRRLRMHDRRTLRLFAELWWARRRSGPVT